MIKEKIFLNAQTGEIIKRKSRFSAWRYFKRDGKVVGYEVRKTDILSATEILEVIHREYERWKNEEKVDGIA